MAKNPVGSAGGAARKASANRSNPSGLQPGPRVYRGPVPRNQMTAAKAAAARKPSTPKPDPAKVAAAVAKFDKNRATYGTGRNKPR